METDEVRKQQEIEFHNKLAADHIQGKRGMRSSSQKFYSIADRSLGSFRSLIDKSCRDRVVLDFGCGDGSNSFLAAKAGASSVRGVDISDVSILNCKKRSAEKGLDGRCTFEVMDCESLRFPDGFFDVAIEAGVLHHVDLEKACAELARVLRKDGLVICYEALGHNPLFQLYRKMTPGLRTQFEVEHLFRIESFGILARHFESIEARYFHLLVLLGAFLQKLPGGRLACRVLEWVDDLLLRVPPLKKHAWITLFVLRRPRKA